MSATGEPDQPPRQSWLALAVGVGLMLAITAYPRLLVDAQGKADHWAATLACWAMAAGLTRGVGFVPRHPLPRWLLSGWACAAALAAVALRLGGGALRGALG
ncbi:cyd operon YbgE family protein [Solimonas variicoloris]|uniref:cyd operon YbgE family protein n=1 Tax=Solimonas variicoloris TaxID=254408 RepID=UPI0003789930|nr:cyd operon YbgE family protein [Solimonas variicoloris]